MTHLISYLTVIAVFSFTATEVPLFGDFQPPRQQVWGGEKKMHQNYEEGLILFFFTALTFLHLHNCDWF